MHVAYCSMCCTLTFKAKLGCSKVGECCRTICVCNIVGVRESERERVREREREREKVNPL